MPIGLNKFDQVSLWKTVNKLIFQCFGFFPLVRLINKHITFIPFEISNITAFVQLSFSSDNVHISVK